LLGNIVKKPQLTEQIYFHIEKIGEDEGISLEQFLKLISFERDKLLEESRKRLEEKTEIQYATRRESDFVDFIRNVKDTKYSIAQRKFLPHKGRHCDHCFHKMPCYDGIITPEKVHEYEFIHMNPLLAFSGIPENAVGYAKDKFPLVNRPNNQKTFRFPREKLD